MTTGVSARLPYTELTGTGTDVTCYLCVAAHINEEFADKTIAELADAELSAVATSTDVDLRPVLRHAVAARRQHQRRDLTLAVTWILTLMIVPLWAIVCTFAVALAAPAARRALVSRRIPYLVMGLKWRRGIWAVGALMCILVLVGFIAVIITPGYTSNLGLDWLTGAFPLLPLLAPLGWLAMYGVVVHHRFLDRRVVIGALGPGHPPLQPVSDTDSPRLAARLAAIDSAQQGNVTIYSGSPFIGFGAPVLGWSFALPLLAKRVNGLGPLRDQSKITSFTVDELTNHIKDRLSKISTNRPIGSLNGHADRLPGLRVEDRVFVNGRALYNYPLLLPHRGHGPAANLGPAELSLIALNPTGAARRYLCAHMPSWDGEVTTSTFLHFSTIGGTLYLHCDRTVLGPPHTWYEDPDRLAHPGQTTRRKLYLFTEGVYVLFPTTWTAPGRFTRHLIREISGDRRRAKIRRLACEDLDFDYGARLSVREMAVDEHYHDHFQAADVDKYLKVVERNVVAATLDFLDDHGVDTAEFRNNQLFFLNQGILQTGGLSVVNNQAVGAGSTAIQQAASGQ
jgi:hypothetical protein